VVVIGVDARSQHEARPVGGVMRMKSAPSSTLAPSLRSSVAMALMRSVSLTRQLAMLRSVVLPLAYRAMRAKRHGGVGDVVAVEVDALSGQLPREISSQLGPLVIWAPIWRAASMKRMSTLVEPSPTPSIRTGAAWAAEWRQGDEVAGRGGVGLHVQHAGRLQACPGPGGERCQPSRCTMMP